MMKSLPVMVSTVPPLEKPDDGRDRRDAGAGT